MKKHAEKLNERTCPEPNTGCLLWTGTQVKFGYGAIEVYGVRWGTHRLAWTLAHGPIPDGKWVLHKCDTPACVNPDHLFLGVARDNTADMIAKGRTSHLLGTRNRRAKLDAVAVREIRAARAQGVKLKDLAKTYGVSIAVVHHAATGARYRDIK